MGKTKFLWADYAFIYKKHLTFNVSNHSFNFIIVSKDLIIQNIKALKSHSNINYGIKTKTE
ncbi:MAG: hypothetical protein ABI793_02125, partial [Flavobacterium sp.]